MRLINILADSYQIEELTRRNIPKYAILSHTWDEREILFEDIVQNASWRNKKGHEKIEMTCQKAFQAGYSHAWIDTCCINKSSSAELSEAINSMYQYYQRSEVCYVYLSDLPASAPLDRALQHCRWFTRGWTLQDWNERGSKRDLVECLSSITGINPEVLLHTENIFSVAVAHRMSWAAGRETTRIEDIAYCLLGIFDVNMPLLYGEEHKAFRRLQDEIIKSTTDLSIFAWRLPSMTTIARNLMSRVYSGILAKSPGAFSGSASFAKLPTLHQPELLISNVGIATQQLLSKQTGNNSAYSYVLPLDCSQGPSLLGIALRKCGPDQFIRENPWDFVKYERLEWTNVPKVKYLLTKLPGEYQFLDPQLSDMSRLIAQTRSYALRIEYPPDVTIYDAWPRSRFDDEDKVFFVRGDCTWDSAAIRFITTIDVGPRRDWVRWETMFYAVGWASLDAGQLWCIIVDYQSHESALSEVQSQVSAWDHDSYRLYRELANRDIPECSKALFIIPGTKCVAATSFTIALVRDPSICQDQFWNVQLSLDFYEA
ncbi:heterokaryon incompatibility protein-domain-containing protein [Xylariaceae sp. FL1651]|nr:heterokaryon incompatibility protein-domain-containing protein [Xylariaceae sp. FL1651]